MVVACRRGWEQPVLTVGPPGSLLLIELEQSGQLSLEQAKDLLEGVGDADPIDGLLAAELVELSTRAD